MGSIVHLLHDMRDSHPLKLWDRKRMEGVPILWTDALDLIIQDYSYARKACVP